MRSFATVEFHRLGMVEKAPGRELPDIPHQLAFSRDGSLIACGFGATVTVRDPKLFVERYTMTRPPPTGGEKFTQFNDLALSPSGTFIAVIAGVTAVDRRIDARLELWNLETRQITPVLDGRPEQVVFLPDGTLVAAERNGSLKFFDPAGRPMPPPGSTGR
jgi:WD40 repeat protein